MRFLALFLAMIISIPTVSARLASDYERECRDELGIAQMQEIQPGILKGQLRDCIRNLAAEGRRPTKEIQVPTPETTTADTYDTACRARLGIAADEIVQPGPRLGGLLRCIDRMRSTESRQQHTKSVRTSVQERISEIGNRILREQEQQEQSAINARSARARARYKQTNVTPFVPSPRTTYRDTNVQDSDAVKRLKAQQCRTLPAREWAACIREALQ